MLLGILPSCQAILPQFAVGGDLISNLNGDGWVVVAALLAFAFARGR